MENQFVRKHCRVCLSVSLYVCVCVSVENAHIAYILQLDNQIRNRN